MSRNRIISSGAEREPSPLLLPLPPVISRGGSRRVEIVRRLLVWQVPLQPPEERRGSSRPGGRFIVAEYKPLFEISWNAYDFASERAFNVGRERERKHKARFRGELRLNVLACPLAPSQTSRLGLNFDSELRKSLFSFGGRRLWRVTGVKGTKLENLGHWMSYFSGLERGKCEKEEETRYQENIGRKEGRKCKNVLSSGWIYLSGYYLL